MDAVNVVYLPQEIVAETLKTLRGFGRTGNEGLIIWLGEVLGTRARVRQAFVPPQRSIQGEDGVGYFVTSETLFAVNKYLHETGLRLLAQVHSHPARAFHSPADDRYAIVTSEGGFSLVVPNFGAGPAALSTWAVYRLTSRRWTALDVYSVEHLFVVEGASRVPPRGGLDFWA